MVKTTYQWMAALALLHLLALGGGVVFLVVSGRLDAERAQKMAAVLSGGDQAQEDAAAEPSEEEKTSLAGSLAGSRSEKLIDDEIEWRNTERYRAQIEQRLKFINAARLDVQRRREEFERLKEQERVEREDRDSTLGQPGYEKELEIIAALKPKAALKQIMSMSDAEAARVLFQLESRKVKKVFEAARTEAELTKLTTVRRLIRDMRPTGAKAAGREGAS